MILMEKEELLKENNVLVKEKKVLLKSKKSLMQENANLRKVLKILKPILENFTIGSHKLYLILNNQKATFDEIGIDFNSSRKQKFVKNMFSKALYKNNSIIYFKYNKIDHKISKYNIKRVDHTFIK